MVHNLVMKKEAGERPARSRRRNRESYSIVTV